MKDQINELHTIDDMAARLKVHKSRLYSRTRIKGSDALLGIIRMGKYLRFEPHFLIDHLKNKYGQQCLRG